MAGVPSCFLSMLAKQRGLWWNSIFTDEIFPEMKGNAWREELFCLPFWKFSSYFLHLRRKPSFGHAIKLNNICSVKTMHYYLEYLAKKRIKADPKLKRHESKPQMAIDVVSDVFVVFTIKVWIDLGANMMGMWTEKSVKKANTMIYLFNQEDRFVAFATAQKTWNYFLQVGLGDGAKMSYPDITHFIYWL